MKSALSHDKKLSLIQTDSASLQLIWTHHRGEVTTRIQQNENQTMQPYDSNMLGKKRKRLRMLAHAKLEVTLLCWIAVSRNLVTIPSVVFQLTASCC